MNCWILRGKSGGVIETRGTVIKLIVTIRVKSQGEWIDRKIPITTFDTKIGETMGAAMAGGYVTLTGKLTGREWQGKHYLDAVADSCYWQEPKEEEQQPVKPENLDDIPF